MDMPSPQLAFSIVEVIVITSPIVITRGRMRFPHAIALLIHLGMDRNRTLGFVVKIRQPCNARSGHDP